MHKAAARLRGSGWAATWVGERDEFRVTLTPSGAKALGVTLLGEPARWRPIGTREKPAQARVSGRLHGHQVVYASDLGESFDMDKLAAPGAPAPPAKAKDVRPWSLVGLAATFRSDWRRDTPCEVCGNRLAPGALCLACDRFRRPDADRADEGVDPRVRRHEAQVIAAVAKATTRRARRAAAKAGPRKSA